MIAVQRLMNAAVDLRQLLRGKKGAVGNQPGASGKVPLRGGVAVDPHIGSIVVPLIQCGPILYPLPSNELDSVLGGMSGKDGIIEIRQQSIVSCQAAGCQLGRRLQLAHILGSDFGDGSHPVQCRASAVAGCVLFPVSDPASLQSEAEPPTLQLHWQETVCLRACGEALMPEVEGQFLEISASFFCCHDEFCSSLLL